MERCGGNLLADGNMLTDGNTYGAMITLKANAGYSFASNTTVMVEGEAVPVVEWVVGANQSYEKLKIDWQFEPNVTEYIQSINLIGVPVATIGNTADTYNYTHTEAGVDKYTVTGMWHEYDASVKEYKPMASADTFRADGAYRLTLQLETELGYVFENLDLLVNDEWVNLDSLDNFEGTANLYYSFGTEITEVEFTVPEPVAGQNFINAASIQATVPSGSNYTVEGNWRDKEGNFTGTFTTGQEYYFESKFYAGDGYYFAPDVEIYVNGSRFEWGTGIGKNVSYSYRSSLKIPIDEVILNNVPKAELGKPFQAGELLIDVPADAKYEAKAQWYDEAGTPVANEVAKSGKRYVLEILLKADSGYEFAESYILKINGIAHQRSGGYDNDVHTMEYSFMEQIHHIEVTGVVEPAVGQTPSTDTLKPAEPTKYEITFAEWIDAKDGSAVTKFESGHAYNLTVIVAAKPGYEFAPCASWKMGGEDGITVAMAVPQWTIHNKYSFETIIPEVRVNNIPTMKVGETAMTGNVSVPVGANYSAEAEWLVWNENKDRFEPFSGIFEEGKTYRLMIRALSNTGYQFERNATTCYLDGVLNDDLIINEDLAYCGIDFAEQGSKVIHKVEFNIKKPVAGEHSSVDPALTLPENANYRQNQNAVPRWILGNIKEPLRFAGYFEEGRNYGVSFDLVADEGYVFAEDLLIVVNGIVLPAEAYTAGNTKAIGGSYFFNMTCQHIYENGKCIVCEAADPNHVPETDGAQTGDNSCAPLWMALLFISGGAAITLTIVEKKRRYTEKH